MKLNKILSLAAVMLYAAVLTSCVKQDVDNPPANGLDPGLTANKTIAQIKALYVSGAITKISGDYVFKAVVVADDRSGNLYKSIVLQDSTGGINIVVDMSNFYTSYETGRNVFVKCKGLVIGDYNGLIQLGGYNDAGSVGRIPQSLVGQHLIGGMWNQSYVTKIVHNFSTLSNTLDQNTLVKLEGVQFDTPCTTWADMVNQTSGNKNLKDAFGNIIVVRTSNYANFGSGLIPGSIGDVVGVFQIYGTTKQLVLRDLNDVQMAPSSCAPALPIGTGGLMSIGSIRPLFSGTGNTFVSGTKVRGTVISDKNTANINSYNLILQDGSSGIMVRFMSPNTFNLNDSIEIDLSATGDSLVKYQQGLELNYIPNSSATYLGTGTVTPNVVTANYVSTHLSSLESTLIQVNSATLSGGGTYSGNVTITDATGTLIIYTRSAATFSGTAYPTGTVSVKGFLSNYNGTPELILRGSSDVQ